jgi:hypothetical protein
MVGRIEFQGGVWVIYLLGPVFALLAYFVTRGQDGRLKEALIGYVLLGLLYSGLLIARCSSRFSWHSLGHLVVFAGVTIWGCSIDAKLDGMGGVLYVVVPALAVVDVCVGILALYVYRTICDRSGGRGFPVR